MRQRYGHTHLQMQTVLSALSWLIYISNSKEKEADKERITLLFAGYRVGHAGQPVTQIVFACGIKHDTMIQLCTR